FPAPARVRAGRYKGPTTERGSLCVAPARCVEIPTLPVSKASNAASSLPAARSIPASGPAGFSPSIRPCLRARSAPSTSRPTARSSRSAGMSRCRSTVDTLPPSPDSMPPAGELFLAGRVSVVSRTVPRTSNFGPGVVKLTVSGYLDTSFGDPTLPGAWIIPGDALTAYNDEWLARDVKVQPDGRIVLAGDI